MMNLKFAAVAVAAAATFCAGAANAQAKYTFYHVLWGMTDANVQFHIRSGEAYMASHPDVEIKFVGPENYDPAEHAKFLDTVVNAEPDGIAMHISSVDAMLPGLRAAAEKGIPFVSTTSHPPLAADNEIMLEPGESGVAASLDGRVRQGQTAVSGIPRHDKAALGEGHPFYANTLCNLATLYRDLLDYDKADSLYRHSLEVSRKVLDETASVQSEQEQLKFSSSLRHRLDHYISLSLLTQKFGGAVFDEVLDWKGATMVRQRRLRQVAGEADVAETFAELQTTTRRLSALLRMDLRQVSRRPGNGRSTS